MPYKFNFLLIKGIFRIALLFDKRDKIYNKKNVSNILLLNTTGMGDALLSTPSIRAVRETFPEAVIVTIVSKAAREVLLNNPCINRFIDFPGKINPRFFYHLPRIIKSMRRNAINLSIVVDSNDPEAPILSYISGAPIRIGWRESRLSFIFNFLVQKRTPKIHFIDSKLKAFGAMGIKGSKKKPEIFLTIDEENEADKFIKQLGIKESDAVGVHPFGAKKYKNWPVKHVVLLLRMLHAKYKCKVLLFGGKKEMDSASGIASEVNNGLINLTGKTDIRLMAALIKKCSLFISTDSGPMHLAQAAGVPTIALFGPTDPNIYGPRGDKNVVIKKHVDCSPCKLYDCPDAKCMSLITHSDIDDAIQTIRKKTR